MATQPQKITHNVGLVDLQVKLLTSRSPFSSQRQQEVNYLFRPENYNMLTDRVNCFPVWEPINGIRCAENIQGFDNYLKDTKNERLEESEVEQIVVIEEDGEEKQATSPVEYDSTSVARITEIEQKRKEDNPDVTQEDWDKEKNFFTWTLSDKTLVKTVPPRNFDEPDQIDGAPEWTYGILQRPGADKGVQMIAPFMKKNPPNRETPIHWALLKNNGIALNQGFEVTYYFYGRESVVVDTQKDFTHKYNFLNKDGKPLKDYVLTNSIYLAFEIGVQKKYLFVFASDKLPAMFSIDTKEKNATLVQAFEGFNPQKIFDPNNKYFNVSIEPVAGCFVLRSNQFFDNPWIILGNMINPFIIEESPIMVYGSNINASFSFRPLTYYENGSFSTPSRNFRVKKYVEPIITSALKGNGGIEQNRSYNKDENGDSDGGKIYMIDAEFYQEGDGEEKEIQTIVEYQAGDTEYSPQNLDRKVKVELIETNEKGEPITKQPAQPDNDDTRDYDRFFKASVSLTSSNVVQPEGYIVVNGKSPYIWTLRITFPNKTEMIIEEEGIDITCDVISIDLNWNSTSFNEVVQTGNIKVLNKPSVSKRDYRQYEDRTAYITIDAGWKCQSFIDEDAKRQRIFTGLTTTMDVYQTAEREEITFRLEDFMHVLTAMKIRLSPYYDGMMLSYAVADIVKMTGLSEDRIFIDDKKIREANLSNDYSLSFLNPFEQPTYKFEDGTSLKDAIIKLAKIDFRTCLFDINGNFHLNFIPGGPLGDARYTALQRLTTDDTSDPFNMVWNMVRFSRITKDAYNALSVVTVDKRDPSIIYVAQSFKRSSIEDPSSDGYLGFEKLAVIRDPAIGSKDGLIKYLETYRRRLFIPPLTASFELYGRPVMQPLKIITLNDQPVRILNISTTINAKENLYWQSIEGEWLFFEGKDQSPQITPSSDGNTPSSGGDGAGKDSTS